MREPLTILVAARDEEQAIAATVRSLRAQFPQAEVIVADDGSLDATALLKAPERLLSTETVRVVTKLILFPVRFLHTVDTGRVGTTEAAVAHFLAGHSGAIAELVRTGFQWRTAPPTGEAEKTRLLPILRSELVPLYLLFLDTYAKRLQEYGLSELSEGLAAWGARLSEPATSS